MQAFQHIIVDAPAVVTLRLDEDGYMRIDVKGVTLRESITVEVKRVERLELVE